MRDDALIFSHRCPVWADSCSLPTTTLHSSSEECLGQFKSLRGPKGQSLKLLHQWCHIYSHPVLSVSAVQSGTVISALNRKLTLEQLHFSAVYLCSFLANSQQLPLMWNECLRQNSSYQNYGSEFTSMHPSLLHKQEKERLPEPSTEAGDGLIELEHPYKIRCFLRKK